MSGRFRALLTPPFSLPLFSALSFFPPAASAAALPTPPASASAWPFGALEAPPFAPPAPALASFAAFGVDWLAAVGGAPSFAPSFAPATLASSPPLLLPAVGVPSATLPSVTLPTTLSTTLPTTQASFLTPTSEESNEVVPVPAALLRQLLQMAANGSSA